MRKKIINLMSCPNSGFNVFEVYAIELIRNDKILFNIKYSDIEENDNIVSYIIINKSSYAAYPIIQRITVLFSDSDVDLINIKKNLGVLQNNVPILYKSIIKQYLKRIEQKQETIIGKWNKDEMCYYDKEVESKK